MRKVQLKFSIILIILLGLSTSSCLEKLMGKQDAGDEGVPEDPGLYLVDEQSAMFNQATFSDLKFKISSIRRDIQYIKRNVIIANQKFIVIKKRVEGLEGQSPAMQETIKLYDILQNPAMVEESKVRMVSNDANIKYHENLREYYRLSKDYEIAKLRVKHAELALNIIDLQRVLLQELEEAFSLTPEDVQYLTDSSKSYDPGYMDIETKGTDKENDQREVTCREMSSIFAIDVCAILGQYDRIVDLYEKRKKYLDEKQNIMKQIYSDLMTTQNQIIQSGQPYEVF
ncbi:MAG: hypothetical protein OEZ22_09190 [Spirochaetia bacterium]|nr:hypothetical protein [Spirochaetia bacterium]